MARFTALLAVILVTGVSASQAAAAPFVTADDVTPTLAKSADGWTASLGFTNITDGPVQLSTTRTGCKATLGDKPAGQSVAIGGARHETVKFTVPTSCADEGAPLSFTVIATATGARPQNIPFTAEAKDDPTGDWKQLRFFAWAAGALMVLALILWAFWDVQDGQRDSFWQGMPYTEATWSFKDSWASNITVGGGLLTGLFGTSEVVRAAFGEDAEASLAIATIGAAIALALIGAGGLVALATKTRDGDFTVGGLLLASVVTVTGAAGELWLVSRSAVEQTGGKVDDLLNAITIAALVLLLVYAARSLRTVFDTGTTAPDPVDHLAPPLTETMFAASMLAEALKCNCPPGVQDEIDRLRIQDYEAGIAALETRADVNAGALQRARDALKALKDDLDPERLWLGLLVMLDRSSMPWLPPRKPRTQDHMTKLMADLDVGDSATIHDAVGKLADVHRRVGVERAADTTRMILGHQTLTAPGARVRPRRRRPRAALL